MIRRRAARPNGRRAPPEVQSGQQSQAAGCRTKPSRRLRHRTSTPGFRAKARAAPRHKGSDGRHVLVGYTPERVDREADATGTPPRQIAIGMLNDGMTWSVVII